MESHDGEPDDGGTVPAIIWYGLAPGEVLVEAGKPAEYWILAFLGEFTELQEMMRFAVQSTLQQNAARLAGKIRKNHLDRLDSGELWNYMKTLATDVGYDRPLVTESNAFHQAKATRNFVAHTTRLDPIRKPDSAQYFYQVISSSREADKIPDPLTPAQFRQLGANCRWLKALISHFASLAGGHFIGAGSERRDGSHYFPNVRHLAPPPLPVGPDWDMVFELQQYEYEPDDKYHGS